MANSIETDSTSQNEQKIILIISKPLLIASIANLTTVFLFALPIGYFFALETQEQYTLSNNITEEEYLEKFSDYKASLQRNSLAKNPAAGIPLMFLSLLFMAGCYELVSTVIALMLKRVTR